MSLVKIFEGTFVNTLCIGKIEFSQEFVNLENGDQFRNSCTAIYDATGVNVLCFLKTKVAIRLSSYNEFDVRRDNFLHSEIIRAIQFETGARSYSDVLAEEVSK